MKIECKGKKNIIINNLFGDNVKNAKYVQPPTQDPNVMKELVDSAAAQKEAQYKQTKEEEAQKLKATASAKVSGAGENKLDGNIPRPEKPVIISKPAETKPENTLDQIEKINNVIPK